MQLLDDTESVITGIFKDGDGYGFRANVPGGAGRQVKRRGFATQDAAYRARIRFLGGEMASSDRTVASWFDEFVTIKQGERRATTAANYEYALGVIGGLIGDHMLDELNETHLREAYAKLVPLYATDSIKTFHWRTRTALRQAVREGKAQRCPANNVTPPQGKKTRARRVWTFPQLMRFTQHTATQRDAAMWAMWMTTGLRRGEVCGLMWDKVDLEAGVLTIDWQRTKPTKGPVVEGPVKTDDGERLIPVSTPVVAALKAWRATQSETRLRLGGKWRGGEYVFTSNRHQPYHPDSFNNRLEKLATGAGVPVLTPHELRHTYATRALENKADIKVLSKLLGHSRIEVTLNLYAHPSDEQSRSLNDDLARRMLG